MALLGDGDIRAIPKRGARRRLTSFARHKDKNDPFAGRSRLTLLQELITAARMSLCIPAGSDFVDFFVFFEIFLELVAVAICGCARSTPNLSRIVLEASLRHKTVSLEARGLQSHSSWNPSPLTPKRDPKEGRKKKKQKVEKKKKKRPAQQPTPCMLSTSPLVITPGLASITFSLTFELTNPQFLSGVSCNQLSRSLVSSKRTLT